MDTPGFSSLYTNDFEKEELKQYFPEFEPYEGQCRFNGCDHVHEPDCAVKRALEEGKISQVRYQNYLELYKELKEKRKVLELKYVIAPSILSADFTQLGKDIKETEEGGAAYLHFDVMDGMFVPNISFGIPVMKSIRKATHQVMDAHLMVQDPIRYVKAFKEAGADLITVHLEACPDVRKTLTEIKDLGIMAGLSYLVLRHR